MLVTLKFKKNFPKVLTILLGNSLIYGCATNPVTGKNELMLIPTSSEISLGENNYGYMQQNQGGEYKGSPELTQLVKSVGNKLAKVSDRPLPYEFVIVNEGTPNAWAMPGGKIAIHRGLLTELETEAELAAVLSHEITHAAAKHSAKAMQRQVLLTAGIAGASIALSDDEEHETRNEAIILAAGVAGSLMMNKYSRSHELEADHYGMVYMERAGYNPQAAVSLQQKFVELSKGKKANWLTGLFASHPPSEDRVKANAAFAKGLTQHQYQGKQRYQIAMKALKAQQPSYDAYTEAQQLYKKNKLDKAMSKINQAIKGHPNESLFYGLKGDIFAKKKYNQKALASYQQAMSINPEHYYPYLKRGLLYQSMGHPTLSKIDLEKAQVMMPTQNAKAALNSMSA